MVSHHVGNTRNTGHGPERSHRENRRSHNVIVNSQNHSYQGSLQHRDLWDDFNSRLRGQDMRDKINEYYAEHAHNLGHDPFYLRQRLVEVQNNLVHQQIADLQEQIERLRRNNDPRNVAVRNLLEEKVSI